MNNNNNTTSYGYNSFPSLPNNNWKAFNSQNYGPQQNYQNTSIYPGQQLNYNAYEDSEASYITQNKYSNNNYQNMNSNNGNRFQLNQNPNKKFESWNRFGSNNTMFPSSNFKGNKNQYQAQNNKKFNKRKDSWPSTNNVDFLENKNVQPMFHSQVIPNFPKEEQEWLPNSFAIEQQQQQPQEIRQGNNINNDTSKYSSFRKFKQHFAKIPQTNENKNQSDRPDLFMGRDESYPPELNKLLNPFFCGVCNSRLNSIKSANIHYESKAHDKQISNWLKKTYGEKGLTVPNLKRFTTEEVGGPFRCELCKIDLTSAQHALQHNNGKRHKAAAAKISPPTGIGYYDVKGDWIETGRVKDKTTGKELSYIMVTTASGSEAVVLHVAPNASTTAAGTKRLADSQTNKEDAAAVPIKKSNIQDAISLPPEVVKQDKNHEHQRVTPNNDIENQQKVQTMSETHETLTDSSPNNRQTPHEALESQQCKLCSVETTSYDQMVLHLKGTRHTKKLRALGEPPIKDLFKNTPNTILESLNETDNPSDVSMFRTPSGSYYCKSCNAALPDLARIRKHIASKAHLVAEKKNDEKQQTKQ